MLDTINSGLDVFMVFARSLMDVNNRVLRTVKSRTHFISCAYYCCLAVENDVSQALAPQYIFGVKSSG